MKDFQIGIALKLARAHGHLEAIKAEVARVTGPDGPIVAQVWDDERKHCVLRVEQTPQLDPMFGPTVGDFLHNVRSVLDHVAWALAEQPQRRTSFPILRAVPSEPKKLGVIGGVSPEALALIETMQPYYDESNVGVEIEVQLHPLQLLSVLNNRDKHRVLLYSVMALDFLYWVADEGEPRSRAVTSDTPLTAGMDVASIWFGRTQRSYDPVLEYGVEVDLRLIDELSKLNSYPVIELCDLIIQYVERVVVPNLTPFMRA